MGALRRRQQRMGLSTRHGTYARLESTGRTYEKPWVHVYIPSACLGLSRHPPDSTSDDRQCENVTSADLVLPPRPSCYTPPCRGGAANTRQSDAWIELHAQCLQVNVQLRSVHLQNALGCAWGCNSSLMDSLVTPGCLGSDIEVLLTSGSY